MGNRAKLEKAFGEGPFGVPDVPTRVGHKFQARIEAGFTYPTGRADRRSWKRRRKTRWRPPAAGYGG